MKKILFSLIAVVLLVCSVGCRKDHFDEELQMVTSYYTVHPEQWITNTTVDYYYAPFENADITADAIERGCVLVYFIDADNRDNPLPYQIFRSADDGNGNDVYYSDNFSFDAEPGVVTFKFQASDFNNTQSLAAYGDIAFKVVVMKYM